MEKTINLKAKVDMSEVEQVKSEIESLVRGLQAASDIVKLLASQISELKLKVEINQGGNDHE